MVHKRRVVVTGIGVISAIGIGREAFWPALLAGKSGITKITAFDTSSFKNHYGGEIKDFDAGDFIPRRKIKFLGKTSQLAIGASALALKDSQLPYTEIPKKKIGVIIGTTLGEKPLEELTAAWAKGGLKDVDRAKVVQVSANNICANIGIHFKMRGFNCLIPTACSAGNYAIGYGSDLIRSGDLNFVLAGGSDAFSYLAYTGFQRLYAMAPEMCQPFDKNRKGMMLGEGAGIIIMESLESATKRKAQIYAEVAGYGLSCDAYHATAPHPDGISRAMEKAINEAGLSYKDVDYVCAHGTGTTANDRAESQAVKKIFKERYREVLVNSIKSMLGHPMGAASAIEAAVCCLAVKSDIVPPTINFKTPDPECDVDCVANKARNKVVNVALNNGFAFGGNNCCVVFKKYKDR
ncbi:MAG: beta-ketoacyl-[acyl-carrier-protein] synthase family protein [Candidatus Omnitrophota bacterium]